MNKLLIPVRWAMDYFFGLVSLINEQIDAVDFGSDDLDSEPVYVVD